MIINVNDHEYQHYIAARDAKQEKHKREETMEEDLANLKGEINEI